MKLSDYQGEDALDLLADILEPITDIAADERLKNVINNSKNKLEIVYFLLKNHKKEILAILARIEGVDVADYKCTVFTLPKAVLEFINDESVAELFRSQGQMKELLNSGSATENTGETEQK